MNRRPIRSAVGTDRPLSSVLVLLPLLVVGVTGCSPTQASLETRTFRLNTLGSATATEIIQPYVYEHREGAPGMVSARSDILTVRELPENLDRIQAVLAEFDQPVTREGQRLQFQLVHADGYESSDPAIADVESELREIFRFRGYRVVGESVVSVSEGEFQQTIGGLGSETWMLEGSAYPLGEPNLTHVSVALRSPHVAFQTGVQVRTGQTLVLGSAQAEREQGAFILIVRASSTR